MAFRLRAFALHLLASVALLYGAKTLWQGRPIYYAFSEDRLQLVQASDVSAEERSRIVAAAIQGGDDVIQMPRYLKPWEQARSSLRQQLRPVSQRRDVARLMMRRRRF